jgi:hypothetical protein
MDGHTRLGAAVARERPNISTIWRVGSEGVDASRSLQNPLGRTGREPPGGEPGPTAESAQPALPRPVENLLEKGTSDPAPSPCGVYPHTADPSHLALVPLTEAVGRAHHVPSLIGEKHHMTSRFSDRTGEVLPVRGGPSRNVCERLAKGIWRLLQSSQAKLSVEAYLVWLQPSEVHWITHKAAERVVPRTA